MEDLCGGKHALWLLRLVLRGWFGCPDVSLSDAFFSSCLVAHIWAPYKELLVVYPTLKDTSIHMFSHSPLTVFCIKIRWPKNGDSPASASTRRSSLFDRAHWAMWRWRVKFRIGDKTLFAAGFHSVKPRLPFLFSLFMLGIVRVLITWLLICSQTTGAEVFFTALLLQ